MFLKVLEMKIEKYKQRVKLMQTRAIIFFFFKKEDILSISTLITPRKIVFPIADKSMKYEFSCSLKILIFIPMVDGAASLLCVFNVLYVLWASRK